MERLVSRDLSCAVVKVRGKREEENKVSGDNSERDPPVPIPNTEVKPLSADGTWLATARESRTSPGSKRELERRERFSNAIIILSSSMAEHSAVNRVVVGSSPTWGATQCYDRRYLRRSFFCVQCVNDYFHAEKGKEQHLPLSEIDKKRIAKVRRLWHNYLDKA